MPGTLVAYGHSWVAGGSASHPRLRLVNTAARLMGMLPTNLGVSGSSSDDTASLVRRDGVPLAQSYLLMTGLNDARLYGQDPDALDAYARSLTTVLDTIASVSPHAWVGLVEQPLLADYRRHAPHNRGSTAAVNAYNEQLKQAAARYPHTALITVEGWDVTSMIRDDTVHPNDLGHAAIGAAVAHAHPSASIGSRTSVTG